MTRQFRKIATCILFSALFFNAGFPAWAGTLYEYYTNTSQETLKKESGEVGRELAATFRQDSIKRQQQQIDFSEYYTNLKKMMLYGSKLATYSEYENDLRFARDREIFKGLPDERPNPGKKEPQLDRKDFVRNKYDLMKKNVVEEIDTYVDLIQLSLDVCESLAGNDLSGWANNKEHQKRMREPKEGKEYRGYLAKQNRLARTWPELAGRISRQLSQWQPRLPSPDDPIIDRKVTGAL